MAPDYGDAFSGDFVEDVKTVNFRKVSHGTLSWREDARLCSGRNRNDSIVERFEHPGSFDGYQDRGVTWNLTSRILKNVTHLHLPKRKNEYATVWL